MLVWTQCPEVEKKAGLKKKTKNLKHYACVHMCQCQGTICRAQFLAFHSVGSGDLHPLSHLSSPKNPFFSILASLS